MISEKIEKCLAFVRYAISPEAFEAPQMSDVDWKQLYKFSVRQAIVGVVVEGVQRLKAQGIQPPREVMVKWLVQTLNIEKHNQKMNKTIVKLFTQLENDGFKCCLLKGQGNNLLYPNVYRRTSGDIDVWLANAGDGETKTDIGKIVSYVRKRKPDARIIYHHIDAGDFENVDVEVHYRPSFMNNPLYNHRLQQWFAHQADAQFANRTALRDTVGTVSVPTPEFRLESEGMIFVTIGTQLPFDRLIRVMDEIAPGLNEEIVAQVYQCGFEPKHIKTVDFLAPDEFNKLFDNARLIVAHPGMGTILSALQKDKPIIVFPRIAAMGEHRNEHQLATARKFKEMGSVNVAMNEEELKAMLLNGGQTALHHIGNSASPSLIRSIEDFIDGQ